MSGRIFVLLSTGLLLAGAAHAHAGEKSRKPNVVVILADDLGYADLGVHGCKDIPTPHLDSIAKNGVRCTSGYVSGVYCSPTRAGLLTGRYQQRYGHEFNPGGAKAAAEHGLPLTEVTLADALKSAGYATGLVGKWHLGSAPKFHPTKRGFQEFFGFLGGAHPYLTGAGKQPWSIQRGTKAVEEKEYLTDALRREGVAFIDRHKKGPFFLHLAFNAVHTPMHALDKYFKRFPKIEDPQRRTYAAMLSAMDDAVGAVLAKLRAEKLEDDTLIFFFSDNGGPTMKGTTINGSRNAPLRGSKRQTLEGGIRVPFFVQWKGNLPAGTVYGKPVIQLDIFPTALAAAGAATPKGVKLDGVDLMPYLGGKKEASPHETLYWRFGAQMAIREGDWKLVRYDDTGMKLYNLKDDVGEKTDLSEKQPEKRKALEGAWKKWDATLAKPLWGAGAKK